MPTDETTPYVEAPTTVKEMGIHIAYMRNDMNEIKVAFTNFVKNTPSHDDLNELKKRLDRLENWRSSIINKIAYSAVVLFITMVLALYGLDKLKVI